MILISSTPFRAAIVAGFTAPGTHVDVVVTMRQGQEAMSRVVVNNLQVLAAGTKLEQEKGRGGQAMPTTVVTLLVTPQDADWNAQNGPPVGPQPQ